MSVPVTSEGSRSGVNWMRLKSAFRCLAIALTARVLARPGQALDQQVAVGEQADQHALDEPGLAEHLGVHRRLEGEDRVRGRSSGCATGAFARNSGYPTEMDWINLHRSGSSRLPVGAFHIGRRLGNVESRPRRAAAGADGAMLVRTRMHRAPRSVGPAQERRASSPRRSMRGGRRMAARQSARPAPGSTEPGAALFRRPRAPRGCRASPPRSCAAPRRG